MKKVFLVTSGEYSDYGIRAAFSTKKLAEKYIADCVNDGGVEEWELDTEIGKVNRTVFRCQMPGGKCWTYEQIDMPTVRVPDPHIVTNNYHEGMFYADSYVSEEHSRKLAIEEHQRRLRLVTELGVEGVK